MKRLKHLLIKKDLILARITRENEMLRNQLERALQKAIEKNAELEASLRRMEELAATDALTGLYNRRYFSRASEQLFAEADRYDKDLACIMLDLDAFKQVNDSHGHQAGDSILALAGKVIAANLRRMDLAARYGGDEFVILLPQAGIDEARIVAQRIHHEFALALEMRERVVHTSMSLGIASVKQVRPASAEQLIAAADRGLYAAKAHGRDRIEAVT